MQILLILAFVIGFSYFVFARRRLDTFTVAFASAALYFLPGFVGYTLTPTTPERPVKLPVALDPETTGIMLFVLLSMVVSATVWDLVDLRRPAPGWRIRCTGAVSYVAAALGVLGLLWTIGETGPALFSSDKGVVIEVVSRGHLLWEVGAALAVIFAYAFRQWWLLTLGMVLLLVDLWIGFRYAFAMAFISLAWLAMLRAKPFRIGSLPRRYFAAVLLGGLAIVSYQNLKEPLRQGDWSEVSRRLSSPVWYAAGVMTSEPFTTQTVLNEIVRRDFRTDTDHLWSASHHLIVFSPSLGAEAVRFNDLQQSALFPHVDHGLANNIWGQMWSATGWTGLVIFVVIYNLVLAAGARIVRCEDPITRGGAILLFAYWCFYIHRNELLVQVGYMKQVFLAWVACVVVAMLLVNATVVTRRQAGGAT
jgi:hypothetical protein